MAAGGWRDRSAHFGFDRSWDFAVPPDRLWALLSDTGAYRAWWPWLRSFEPVPIRPGATTRCSIGSPLPYRLRLDIAVVDVAPAARVVAEVSGDVRGPARLEITAVPTGSSARLAWEVEVRRPVLRAAALVAKPLLQWGHDRVVRRGVEQFRRATGTSA
jgi:uncharacterized protein YndB with AHSA1/START domain